MLVFSITPFYYFLELWNYSRDDRKSKINFLRRVIITCGLHSLNPLFWKSKTFFQGVFSENALKIQYYYLDLIEVQNAPLIYLLCKGLTWCSRELQHHLTKSGHRELAHQSWILGCKLCDRPARKYHPRHYEIPENKTVHCK